MSSNRFALIIANDQYGDESLSKLEAPKNDAYALAEVLGDPETSNFYVQLAVNKQSHTVNQLIEAFFNNRKRDDLLLLYFSGHGLKDEDGKLFFATPNTRRDRLLTTAISASLVNELMRRTRSRSQILLLDCCYSGAFAKGMIAKSGSAIGSAVGTNEQFQGRGRIVLTASDSMQYAFEEDKLVEEGPINSLFTNAIVEGIRTWEADRDGDNRISIHELYDYIDWYVSEKTPNQQPAMWSFNTQGEMIIAERDYAPEMDEEIEVYVPESKPPEEPPPTTEIKQPQAESELPPVEVEYEETVQSSVEIEPPPIESTYVETESQVATVEPLEVEQPQSETEPPSPIAEPTDSKKFPTKPAIIIAVILIAIIGYALIGGVGPFGPATEDDNIAGGGEPSEDVSGPIEPPEGMVSWWPGDGTAEDIVGESHGTLMNGVSFSEGLVGDAFDFTKPSHWVYGEGEEIANLQEFTIEFWVKMDRIIDNHTSYFVFLEPEKASLRYSGLDGPRQLDFSCLFDTDEFVSIRVDNVLVENQWHHVAGTYDGIDMRLYLDGEEIGLLTVGQSLITGTGFCWLGDDIIYYDGLLDEVTIYNRAINSTEIKRIYEAGGHGKNKSVTQSTSMDDSTPTIEDEVTTGEDEGTTNTTSPLERSTSSGWSATKPIIDGLITNEEWNDASQKNITLIRRFGPVTTPDQIQKDATLFVKNDAENLYIALKVFEVPYAKAQIFLLFDQNSNGYIDQMEDLISADFSLDDQWIEDMVIFHEAELRESFDRDEGGNLDVVGNYWHTNPIQGEKGTLCLEIMYPLDSGDIYDMSVKPGDQIGFGLEYVDMQYEHSHVDLNWPKDIGVTQNWEKMTVLAIAEYPS